MPQHHTNSQELGQTTTSDCKRQSYTRRSQETVTHQAYAGPWELCSAGCRACTTLALVIVSATPLLECLVLPYSSRDAKNEVQSLCYCLFSVPESPMTLLKVRWLSAEPTASIRNAVSAMRHSATGSRQSHDSLSMRGLRTAARSSLKGSSGDAWSESGWADEEDGTPPQQSFPDVSLLTSGEIVCSS